MNKRDEEEEEEKKAGRKRSSAWHISGSGRGRKESECEGDSLTRG